MDKFVHKDGDRKTGQSKGVAREEVEKVTEPGEKRERKQRKR